MQTSGIVPVVMNSGSVLGALTSSGPLGELLGYQLLIKGIIIISTIGILLLSLDFYGKLQKGLLLSTLGVSKPEYVVLILMSSLGMLCLVSSNDLIALYLSIELLSLSLYLLAGIKRQGQYSTEASLRYYILGGLSSGILLLGCSLIVIATGGLSAFTDISYYLSAPYNDNLSILGSAIPVDTQVILPISAQWPTDTASLLSTSGSEHSVHDQLAGRSTPLGLGPNNPLIYVGFIFITIAFLFKLAGAPFHL